jgi:hypothetical protein
MYGYNTPSLLLLHALNSRTIKFDPSIASHASLLEQGLVVQVKGTYYSMSTDSMYEAQEFESVVKNLESFGSLQVVGVPETPGVQVREFGVDLTTGKDVSDVSVETTHRFNAGGLGAEEDDDAPSFPATPLDPSQRTEAVMFSGVPEEGLAPETPIEVSVETLGAYTDEMTEQFTQEQVEAGMPIPENPAVEEPTMEIDDTLQWERVIGDLPQAFENLRPTVRLLVHAGMNDVIFQKIYSSAFQAKEVARSQEFIKTFNEELPALMNEKGDTVAVWFESWLHDLTKRVLTFDGSEEVQAAFRAIMKLVPDDKKKDIQEYLQEQYINTGIGRFFPEAVRRFKDASTRATIAKPVSWILKTAESINEQAEKEMKRPPQADPALIEYAIDLMPPGTDRTYARERLMHRLGIGNGIAMDEVLSEWETYFGGDAQPALRYSWIHNYLKKNGKLYLNTKEAITQTAKEIIWGLLTFVQHPVPEPIGSQTWMESNAAQIKWIKAAQDVLEDHLVDGETIYLKAWNKFMDEKWAENKVLLMKKEGE